MSFGRNYTQRELDYIRDRWQADSCAEIAAHLGRSKSSVYKKINDMHLKDDARAKGPPPMESGGGNRPSMDAPGAESALGSIGPERSDLDRLRGLRDLIWQSMLGAEPAEVAKLAPEFRKTIDRIEQMEGTRGGDSDSDAGEGLSDILALVP